MQETKQINLYKSHRLQGGEAVDDLLRPQIAVGIIKNQPIQARFEEYGPCVPVLIHHKLRELYH